MVLSVLAGVFVLAAADKPSPFAVKKSEPVVPMAAPVSPVVRPVRPPAAAAPVAMPAAVSPLPKVIRPENRVTPPPAEVAAAVEPPPAAGQDRIKQAEPIVVEVEDKAPPIQDVRVGMPKDDVMAVLGKAATRISMYDGSDYVEVLRYEWKGQWAGSVRLSNGKVIKIDKPR